MHGLAQGADRRAALALRFLCRLLLLALLGPWIHGCVGGAQGLAEIAPDTSLATASIPADSAMTDEKRDARFILARLLEEPDATGTDWENAATGARGTILGLEEVGRNDTPCLAFAATRENYGGVGLYDGLACQASSGIWNIREFAMR